MVNTVPTQPADEFARGWRAAVQRIGDLMLSIDDEHDQGVINTLYRRLVVEGPRPVPDPYSNPGVEFHGGGGGWLSGPCIGGPDL